MSDETVGKKYLVVNQDGFKIIGEPTESFGKVESSIDQGYCPVCNQSAQRTMEDVIDDDDEIGYECISCEVEYVEVRHTVGYKNLRKVKYDSLGKVE